MCRAALLSLCLALVSVAAAQHHHHDPFAGSNCTCDTFCASKCSIFPLPAPTNVTLYRMTPAGVFALANKNTGDVHGDTSFVISRRTQALECRENPASFFCHGIAQFDGDDGHNTDLVLELTVELDGRWGPYLPCNPVNVSEPLGPWFCATDLRPPTPAGGGPHCKNFSTYGGYAWKGATPHTVPADTLDACCAAASAAGVDHWDYANGTCSLYNIAFATRVSKGSVLGYRESGPPPCNCTRLYKTVGRENLTTVGYPSSMHPAGGEWYSHPAGGECAPGGHVGDGSGCTWRLVERRRVIAAKCLYNNIDTHIEKTGGEEACFSACPDGGKNRSTTCYLKCYSSALNNLSPLELVEPWAPAFASEDPSMGGCPQMPTPALE